LRRLARATFLLAAASWTLSPACSLAVNTDPLQEGCPSGQKKCEVAGEPRCVSASDPAFGCARVSCVPCTLPHAVEVCDSKGECAVGTCIPEYQNCDLVARNGCEVDLNTSYDNCARCGASCTDELRNMPHTAKAECERAHCVVAACEPGYGDCDNAGSTGCERPLAPALCGRCMGCPEGTTCNVDTQHCE